MGESSKQKETLARESNCSSNYGAYSGTPVLSPLVPFAETQIVNERLEETDVLPRTEWLGRYRKLKEIGGFFFFVSVGLVPWIVAFSTFIHYGQFCLAGVFAFAFLFFLFVILARKVRQYKASRRNELNEGSRCLEDPPPYEMVVLSPPPYEMVVKNYPMESPMPITHCFFQVI